MAARRVVVTGMGLVTPLGCGVARNWHQLLNGSCGITNVNYNGFDEIPSKVAAYVPRDEFNAEKRFSKSDIRTLSLSTLYAYLAAEEALEMANWSPKTEDERRETGVAVGSGMCDIEEVLLNGTLLTSKGYKKVSPHFVTKILVNMPAGNLSIKYGLKGPNHSVSTACATGLHAIGDAFNFIQKGCAKVMLCGGTEATISPLSVAGFSRIRALCCDFNDNPSKASRPFDAQRCGFVIGEGCGLMVLEELEHALARNAQVYAEILGYGLSGDGNHITAPDENGGGAKACMEAAMKDACLQLDDVSHINCHATSTPLGDKAEANAIRQLFGSHAENIALTSTKGAIGHLLGAAGSVEAIYTALACFHLKIPPTLNLEEPLDTNLNIVKSASDWPTGRRHIALTNSFGFGGTNVSVAMGRFK